MDAAEKLRASNSISSTINQQQPNINNGSLPATTIASNLSATNNIIPVISFNISNNNLNVLNNDNQECSIAALSSQNNLTQNAEQQQQQASSINAIISSGNNGSNVEPNRVNVLQCVISSGHVAVLLEVF